MGGEPGSCEHVRCRSPRREGGERNLGRSVLAPCAAEGSLAKLLGVLGQSRPSEDPASPWNSPASVSLLCSVLAAGSPGQVWPQHSTVKGCRAAAGLWSEL